MTYSEKLKDPRWQKKRLEVFERDVFKCTECLNSKLTLHVHHKIYRHHDPWEAEINDLCTLCEQCHELEEDLKKDAYLYALAKASNKTCLWFWRVMSAVAFLKVTNKDALQSVLDILNSNSTTVDIKPEYQKFMNNPCEYVER